MKKTVLITGASRGIGASTAYKFASNQYNVIINYNNSYEEAIKLEKNIKDNFDVKTLLVKCDITNELEIKKMYDKIEQEFGNIDVIVNNAGIAKDAPLEAKNIEDFKLVLNTNLIGPFLVIKYGLKVLKEGAIINVSSDNALGNGYIESIDYDISKSGLITMSHDFAKDLAPNIRVNVVAPGWVETDMNKEISKGFKNREIEKIFLKRFATPDEIANVIYFLASDEASYVNDAVIKVNGGTNGC